MLASSLTSYGLLFLFVFIGSLGVPGSSVWILSAAALAASVSDLFAVILVVSSAAVLGDIASYELARWFATPLSTWLRRFKLYQHNAERTRERLAKSGFSVVFLTRFLFTELGSVVSYVSGFELLDRKKYYSAVILGESIYGMSYSLLGYLFKETWSDVYAFMGDILLIALIVIVAIFVIRYAIKRNVHAHGN